MKFTGIPAIPLAGLNDLLCYVELILKNTFLRKKTTSKESCSPFQHFLNENLNLKLGLPLLCAVSGFGRGDLGGDDSLFDNPLLLPIHLTHAHKIKRLTIFLLFLFYTFSIFLKRSFDKISGKREKQGACKKLWPAVTFCNISCATCAYFRRLMDTEVFAVLQF